MDTNGHHLTLSLGHQWVKSRKRGRLQSALSHKRRICHKRQLSKCCVIWGNWFYHICHICHKRHICHQTIQLFKWCVIWGNWFYYICHKRHICHQTIQLFKCCVIWKKWFGITWTNLTAMTSQTPTCWAIRGVTAANRATLKLQLLNVNLKC